MIQVEIAKKYQKYFSPISNKICKCPIWQTRFYRTRVQSLAILVTNSVDDSLTLWSRFDWCDPGVWRYQLKTCWDCYCCQCWWWGSCWQQFFADLELRFGHRAKVLFRLWAQGLVRILKLEFGAGSLVEMLVFDWNFEFNCWLRSGRWNLIKICFCTCDMT